MRSKLVVAWSMFVVATIALAGWTLLDTARVIATLTSPIVHTVDGDLLERPGFGDVPVAAHRTCSAPTPPLPPPSGIRRGIVVDAGGELDHHLADAVVDLPRRRARPSATQRRLHPPSRRACSHPVRASRPPRPTRQRAGDRRFVVAAPHRPRPHRPVRPARRPPRRRGHRRRQRRPPRRFPAHRPRPHRAPTTTPPITGFDLSLDRFYINQAVPVFDTNQPGRTERDPAGRTPRRSRPRVRVGQ